MKAQSRLRYGYGLLALTAMGFSCQEQKTEITIASPAHGSFTQNAEVRVVGTVSGLPKDGFIQIGSTHISGGETQPSGGEFSVSVSLRSDDLLHPFHPIRVKAIAGDGSTVLDEEKITVMQSRALGANPVPEAFALQLVDTEIGLGKLETRVEDVVRDKVDAAKVLPREGPDEGCTETDPQKCPHFTFEWAYLNEVQDEIDEEHPTADKEACDQTDDDGDVKQNEIDYCRVFELWVDKASPLAAGIDVDIQRDKTAADVDLGAIGASLEAIEVDPLPEGERPFWPCDGSDEEATELLRLWGGVCRACKGDLHIGSSSTSGSFRQDPVPPLRADIDVDQMDPVTIDLLGDRPESCPSNSNNPICFIPYRFDQNVPDDKGGGLFCQAGAADIVRQIILEPVIQDLTQDPEGKPAGTPSKLEEALAKALAEPDGTVDDNGGPPDKQPESDPRDWDAPVAGAIEDQLDKLDLRKPFSSLITKLGKDLGKPLKIDLDYTIQKIQEVEEGVAYTIDAGFSAQQAPGAPRLQGCLVNPGTFPGFVDPQTGVGHTHTQRGNKPYGFAAAISTNAMNQMLCAAIQQGAMNLTFTRVPDLTNSQNLFSILDATAGNLGTILNIHNELVRGVGGNKDTLLELRMYPTVTAPNIRRDLVARFSNLFPHERPILVLAFTDLYFEIHRRGAPTQASPLLQWAMDALVGLRLDLHHTGKLEPFVVAFPAKRVDRELTPEDYARIQVRLLLNPIGVDKAKFEGTATSQGTLEALAELAGTFIDNFFFFNPILLPSFEKVGLALVELATSEVKGGGQEENWSHLLGNFELGFPPELAPIGDQCLAAEQKLEIALSAKQREGRQIALSHSRLPKGAVFSGAEAGTALFRWTPTKEQAGEQEEAAKYGMDFSASVQGDVQLTVQPATWTRFLDEEIIDIFVLKPGEACFAALEPIGNRSAKVNQLLTFELRAMGNTGVRIQIREEPEGSLPKGATLTEATLKEDKWVATFSWTPGQDQVKTWPIRFVAGVGLKKLAEEAISISVTP